MNAKQFNLAIERWGLSVYAAAPVLGIGLRQLYRYTNGQAPIPKPVAKLITIVARHGISTEEVEEIK
jgi:hypothetical protein